MYAVVVEIRISGQREPSKCCSRTPGGNERHLCRYVSLSPGPGASTAPTELSQRDLLFANPPPITPPTARLFPILTPRVLHTSPVLPSTNCFAKYGKDIKAALLGNMCRVRQTDPSRS